MATENKTIDNLTAHRNSNFVLLSLWLIGLTVYRLIPEEICEGDGPSGHGCGISIGGLLSVLFLLIVFLVSIANAMKGLDAVKNTKERSRIRIVVKVTSYILLLPVVYAVCFLGYQMLTN